MPHGIWKLIDIKHSNCETYLIDHASNCWICCHNVHLSVTLQLNRWLAYHRWQHSFSLGSGNTLLKKNSSNRSHLSVHTSSFIWTKTRIKLYHEGELVVTTVVLLQSRWQWRRNLENPGILNNILTKLDQWFTLKKIQWCKHLFFCARIYRSWKYRCAQKCLGWAPLLF